MKKRLFLILSVTVMLAAGCGNKDNAAHDIEAGAAETVTDTGEPDMAEDKEAADADQAENGDAGKEQAETETAEETEPEDGDKEAGETQEPKPASQPVRQNNMEENATEYRFGAIEDILRNSEAEPTEPDRTEEMDGGILLTSGIRVYLPRFEINVHEGFFCHMKDGRLEPLYFLTAIYDRTDKEFLYDAEENFVDTVHQWLKGKCTPKQLEQEPCGVKGIREEFIDGKGIQTGGSGRNPCGDGRAC